MTQVSVSELNRQLELLHAQERERIAQAPLQSHASGGVPFADLGHLVVIDCPACGKRMAFYIDFSCGMPGLTTQHCEYCHAEVEGYLTRGLPPVEMVEITAVRAASQA